MRSWSTRIALAFGITVVAAGVSYGQANPVAPEPSELDEQYAAAVRPLLERYCVRCHSAERTEADIDLAAYPTAAEVRTGVRVWQKVDRMLDSRQMPPKKAKQPTDEERERLRNWVRELLRSEAEAHAGDPGRVVLRRLSNAQYTYTIRDLTGVDTLDPAREFPIDGAAGEGFTNTGDALVMSPSLVTKYLDAAKEVARHAVLLPDRISFSPYATRRDWTDAAVRRIREFYAPFTHTGGASAVNLQGIQFDTNRGGRLPLGRYLTATLAERDALDAGSRSVEEVARERKLSAKYLRILWDSLRSESPSFLLDGIRARWREAAEAEGAKLASEIEAWQNALWKFNPVGHVGREGGSNAWLESVDPVASSREFRVPLPEEPNATDPTIYLSTLVVGEPSESDVVVWRNPRLEGGGKPALSIRVIDDVYRRIEHRRREFFESTEECLGVAAKFRAGNDIGELARRHSVEAEFLRLWIDFLALGDAPPVRVSGHFTETLRNGGGYDFVNGWGSGATPSIVANASDQEVRIPGIARPRSIVVHPSPSHSASIGWLSPIEGTVRVRARIADAHPECGNGVEWVVQHHTGREIGALAKGEFGTRGSAEVKETTITVRPEQLVSVVVGPRAGNHACDLTAVELVISEVGGDERVWDLAKDVSGDLLAGNPHVDGYGNATTWHFYSEPMADVVKDSRQTSGPPAGSLAARWLAEADPAKKTELAAGVELLVLGAPPENRDSPDGVLFAQLRSLAVPNDLSVFAEELESDPRFGKHPLGLDVRANDLVVRVPDVQTIRIPAELAAGRELVVTGSVGRKNAGSAQLFMTTKPMESPEPVASAPIFAPDRGEARLRVDAALAEFRALFPLALCYVRIVPVDEVVTLTLFHREDDHLKRLMLDEAEAAELDRLWNELRYIHREPLRLVVAFEQIAEFATQDRPDLVVAFKPLGVKIRARAERFRRELIGSEPKHLSAVLEFADRAWRRPLTGDEAAGLLELYRDLRTRDILHEDAVRLVIARVLTSPQFLYRMEAPESDDGAAPISTYELANRLSYFLWASMPDASLRRAAESGELLSEETLLAETRRMLADPRTRRLAIEFGCQWLHIRGFDVNAEKNEALYPQFADLRGAMYEESIQVFEHFFRDDGSVLDLIGADYAFLNETLAKHYGVDGVTGDEWRRVSGMRERNRGGILAMAAVLASQSGASRTSPILRGNWVSETLLGERLPRPPPNVPQLPDAVPEGRTARELIEKHSSVPECAKCHARIDPYGFALEQFDAIGRERPERVDTKTTLVDGVEIEGLEGLRTYLLGARRADFLRQFCRKLLGYALGRAVQLSDEPLLEEIERRLAANAYRVSVAIETIVTSPQFREIRGRSITEEN